jgi:hypothetical protein
MSFARALGLVSLLASSAVLTAACGGAQSGADGDDVPRISTSLVNASAVVSVCPDGKRMNAKLAADAIQRLVKPCAAVPGGKAHFMATLQPGGKIELTSPEGDPGDGVVPTCVLRHALQHTVLLKKPCRFDVQLEERKVDVPTAGTN